MPLRAKAITLSAENPVGPYTLTGLEANDLIVVVGPNGAGKSSLLQPFKPVRGQPSWGAVTCVSEAGEEEKFAAQSVEQAITVIQSADLMTQIRDLSAALDLAVNTTRLQHESRLLSLISARQERAANAERPTEPPELVGLQAQHIAADERCGSLPRTDDCYAKMGTELASQAGITWAPLPAGADAHVRCEHELLLRPVLRELQGATPLIQALASLDAVQAGQAAGVERAATARDTLVQDIARKQGRPEGEVVEELLNALDAKAKSLEECINAKDRLAACRREAKNYLGVALGAGRPPECCPVCDQAFSAQVAHDQLAQRDARSGAHDDHESRDWSLQLTAVREGINLLSESIKSVESARQQAQRVHAQVRNALTQALPQFTPAVGWAASVRQSGESIAARCKQWLQEFEHPSSAADTQLAELKLEADKIRQTTLAAGRELNADLANRQSRFSSLQSLGAALAVRHALNAIEWTADLGGVEALARARAVRMRWISVLSTMAQERGAAAESARTTLLEDKNIIERFDRLLGLLSARHPQFAGVVFRGDGIYKDDDRITALSEGQTVLVNLAATLAVVGAVGQAGRHRPGWIVFDEPTNGLDPNAIDAVAQYLGSMSTEDVPSQIFVSTFDEKFAANLRDRGRKAGRRVRVIVLPVRGQAQLGKELTPESDQVFVA